MEYNWFGIPYVGSDICGFNGNTTEELCLRWHQMGAFHSFCRDHNTHDGIPQDPAVWPSVANAARIALGFRYKYLPYLYSLHYTAAVDGHTVIRPLFFEFPTDSTAMEIDHQFMWGSALMVAPALQQGVTSVHAYFPEDVWYSLVPESYATRMDVGYVDVEARLDSLTPVYARGGYVIPRQQGNMTTTQSRLNPLEVLVTVADNVSSRGELYWDAGDDLFESLDKHKRHHWNFTFTMTSSTATLSGVCESCDLSVSIPSLDVIEVLGYGYYPNFSSFQLNGKKVNINVQTSSFSPFSRRLLISTPNLVKLSDYASSDGRFVLSWSHQQA
ncbi:glycosyl hydrolase, family 31 [Ancylostoma caninum]|uniref:Glycosyl hydrolase, family 31 n=1 Tax=Ancylostoma caninum TaxID=29170 RepID=A0A368H8T2_ANCCA|nr:glycosyl hydrolase, family 31 [Ancylostoma caninum]